MGSTVLAITLVSAAGLLAGWALRRRPAARHFVLLVSLICSLASPVVVTAFRASGTRLVEVALLPVDQDVESVWRLSSTPHDDVFASSRPLFQNEVTREEGVVAGPAPSVPGDAQAAAMESPRATAMPDQSTASPPVERGSDPSQQALAVALVAWLLGVAGMLLYVARGYLWLGRMLRRAVPVDCAEANAELRCASDQLMLRCVPDLRSSGELRTPIACGVMQPMVVLPAQLLEDLDREQLRDILVHEVAHLRRRDPLVLVLQVISGCLYWPIPFVHLLNRQLGRAREEICDNFVLASRDPIHYGRTLLQVAELACGTRPPHVAVGALHWRGDLERRIADLIDRKRDTRTRPGLTASAAILGGFLAFGLAVCGAELVAAPQQTAGAEDRALASGVAEDGAGEPGAESAGPKRDSEPEENGVAEFEEPTGIYELQVLDPDGNPVAGANVEPWAVAYRGGSSGVRPGKIKQTTTDGSGRTKVSYPLTAGHPERQVDRLALRIEHPEYPTWSRYLDINRLDPVVLAVPMRVSIRARRADNQLPVEGHLLAAGGGVGTRWKMADGHLVSGPMDLDSEWASTLVRVVAAPESGPVLFSDMVNLSEAERDGNRISLDVILYPSVRVEGTLADEVPRPVRDGRVTARIVRGTRMRTGWHWSAVAEVTADGRFTIEALPRDEHLQIVALCDGWAVDPPSPAEVNQYRATTGYPVDDNHGVSAGRVTPRLYHLTSEVNRLVAPMHRTADVRVRVVDEHGFPVADATAMFSANQKWHNSGSQLLGEGSDSLEFLKKHQWDDKQPREAKDEVQRVTQQFAAKTDERGVAVIRGIPAHPRKRNDAPDPDRQTPRFVSFEVRHPDYERIPEDNPRSFIGGPSQHSRATVDIVPGETATTEVRMRQKKPIADVAKEENVQVAPAQERLTGRPRGIVGRVSESPGRDTFEILALLKRIGASYEVVTSDEIDVLALDLGKLEIELEEDDWRLLGQLRHVKFFELGGKMITDDDLAHLIKFPELEGLGLSNAEKVTGAGLQHLGGMNLRHLILGTMHQVADAELRHLASLRKLQMLSLSGTGVRGAGLEHLQRLPELRHLTISNSPMTDSEMEPLGEMSRLVEVHFYHNTNFDGSFLRHMRPLGELARLNLRHSSINDEGLAAGGPLPQVRTLELDGSEVTDAGLKHLQGWAHLEVLALDGRQLTVTAADHLNDLPNLRELRLFTLLGEPHSRVTDAMLRALRLAPRLESLRIVGPTSITATGIAELAKLPNLKRLEFGSESLEGAGTQASIGQLKQAHPNMAVLVGGKTWSAAGEIDK